MKKKKKKWTFIVKPVQLLNKLEEVKEVLRSNVYSRSASLGTALESVHKLVQQKKVSCQGGIGVDFLKPSFVFLPTDRRIGNAILELEAA
jgi:hypothetical protein